MRSKTVSSLMLVLLLIGILPVSFYFQPVEGVTASTVTYDYYVVAGHNMTPTPPSPIPSPPGFNFTVDPPVFNFGNVSYWGGRSYLYDGFSYSPYTNMTRFGPPMSGAKVNITNHLGYDITITALTAEVTDGTPTKDFFFTPGNVTFGNWTMVIVDTLDPGEYDECNYTTGMVEVNRLSDGDTYNKITGDPHYGERNQGSGSLLEPDANGDAAATGHVAPIPLANGATFTEYFGVIIFGDADAGIQINGTITLSLTYEYTIPGSPVASFTYSPTEPPISETVTFDASASYDPEGVIVSYSWDFGDETNGTGMITNHTYTTPGLYTVALNVTDNDGKWASASKSVRASPNYEDFLTYSEVDPNNHVSVVNSTHIEVDAYRNEDAYVYKDYGMDFFHECNFTVDVRGDFDTGYGHTCVWMLSNDLDDQAALRNSGKRYLAVYLYRGYYSDKYIKLEAGLPSDSFQDDVMTNALADTWYYLTIRRTRTSVTVKVFSDPDRSILIDTLSLVPTYSNIGFRYVFACNTYNSGSSTQHMKTNIAYFAVSSRTHDGEITIFEDDFESYSVGTFPSAGGWELWTDGAGSEHQVIVDSFSNSPTKSLQLLGRSGWSAFAAHPYSTTQRFLSYEVHVRVNELATQYSIARVGFVDWYSYPTTPRFFSAVAFMFDGTIRLAGYGELQTFVPGEWYKVKQVTDRVDDTSSVWINDVLKASNVPVTDSGPPRPDVHFNDTIAFAIASLWPGVEAYFDDAKLVEDTPVITILSPQNRSYASTSVPLTFTVNEVTSWMGYSLDGQANVTVAGNTTLTGLLEGSHNVVVYANNSGGAMWASSPVYFTVDLTPPTVSVLSPENTTYVTFSAPLVFTVSEPTSWMGYSLDDQANVTISGNTTLSGLTDGLHSVVVYVNDTAGNMGASSEVSFTLSLPPVISILSPENTSYAVNDLPLTFTVDVPADWIGYSLDGQVNVTIVGNTTLTSLAEGLHDVVVYANDTVGDMGSSAVYFTVDLTPPTVLVLSPENTTYVTFSVPLVFTVSEPTSWMGYSLNDQANVTISGNTTLSGLTEGSHRLVVYVKDAAENTGVSNKVFFSLELPVGGLCTISLEPSKTILALGYTVTVAATITNITDCAGYQLWIDYDPAVLEMVSWTFDTDPANPLSLTQMAPAPADRVDVDISVPGSVKIATIWKSATPTYSGSGVVAEITFNATLLGNSTLNFDQSWTRAIDDPGNDILFQTLIDSWIFVTIQGDVDGDRDVDVGDQRKVALAMFTIPGVPYWDPNMDIDCDLDVDVGDQRKQQLNMFESW